MLAQMRYANNSNYKNDTMIRKEAFVSAAVLLELKRIIEDSEVRPPPLAAACPCLPSCGACILCAAEAWLGPEQQPVLGVLRPCSASNAYLVWCRS